MHSLKLPFKNYDKAFINTFLEGPENFPMLNFTTKYISVTKLKSNS